MRVSDNYLANIHFQRRQQQYALPCSIINLVKTCNYTMRFYRREITALLSQLD